jgi:hypothetical protein
MFQNPGEPFNKKQSDSNFDEFCCTIVYVKESFLGRRKFELSVETLG